MRSEKSVEICVCAFRRDHIVDTLSSIEKLDIPRPFDLSVIVVDNDTSPSARARVEGAAAKMRTPVAYRHAPGRNVSIARNACLDLATADWVAFIDDDEEVHPSWLAELLTVAIETEADVVFGPAIARYPNRTPEWIVANDFHSNIPQRRDGVVETGHTCNVLMRRAGEAVHGQRFLTSRGGTGGEDTEFFFRLARRGARMEIATAAIATEIVEPDRLRLSWIVRRKMSQGWGYTSSMELNTALRKTRVAARSFLACGYCLSTALTRFYSRTKLSFWVVRGSYHFGAFLGVFCPPRIRNYGSGP